MTGSFPIPLAHVAILHRKPVGYQFCARARAGGSNSRSLNGSTSQNLTAILPAPFFQSASHLLPAVGRLLTTRTERTRTHALLVVSAFLPTSRDILPGIFLNLLRRLWAAGSPSFGSFVKHRQEPTSCILSTFQFSPAFLSAVVHVGQSDRRNGQGVVT